MNINRVGKLQAGPVGGGIANESPGLAEGGPRSASGREKLVPDPGLEPGTN